mmetsp:Transcript_28736/g.62957  ORF Transcript_28736/g.62957 Transcript_28736/m.62957 type:complete len:427 (-) Transcript_28736:163-1443(-)|eukprot:CAMPEP_0118945072 /NCGR_PEP_ID=MMETSP1169-20130426/41566_1 /TAXON_ID=36882 /ORGANISM="Pyramimonas obovata, Strain CCMP722" /LENGTH=426 /DNA_ID=CAMNT_0006890709 /DNA_START=63 /DNA_END=1343 /DNA_ORIENTATION=+
MAVLRSLICVYIAQLLLGCVPPVSSKKLVAVQTHGALNALNRRLFELYASQAKQDSVSQRYDFVVLHDSTRVLEDDRNDTWKTVHFSEEKLMARFPRFHLCRDLHNPQWDPEDPSYYCRYVMHAPAFAFLLDQVDDRGAPYEAFWIIEYDCFFKGNLFSYFAEKDEGEYKDADLVEDFSPITNSFDRYKKLYYDRKGHFTGYDVPEAAPQPTPSPPAGGRRLLQKSGTPRTRPTTDSPKSVKDRAKLVKKFSRQASHTPPPHEQTPSTQQRHPIASGGLKHKKHKKRPDGELPPRIKFDHAVGDLMGWGARFGFDLNNIVRDHMVWKAREHVLRFSREYLTFLTHLNELGLFQHGEYMIPTMCKYTSHNCIRFHDQGSTWRYKPSLHLSEWTEAEVGKWYHPLKLDTFTDFENGPTAKDAFFDTLQ